MVEFKEIKVGDIFEVRRGGRVTRAKQKPGNIPYVTAVTTNNGVDTYISNPKFTDSNILTANFFGNVFYQPNEVGYKDGTYGLKLKEIDKRRRRVYLYLASVIEKVSLSMGSYSNGLIAQDFEEMSIKVPVTPEGGVGYEYMENYIKEIEQKYISNLKQKLETDKTNLLKVIGKKEEDIEEVIKTGFNEVSDFKELKLSEVFKKESIQRGKRIVTKDRKPGGIPLVTSGKENYGVSGYIKEHTAHSEGNVVTIDMFGNVFYREYGFFFDDNIIVFDEGFTKGVYLYITSTLSKLSQLHGYSKQFRYKDISTTNVTIPIKPDGTPDFQYMERYISYIELAHTHNFIETEQERIGKIEELIR